LIGVLKVNFRKHGRGAEKIERGEFVIQDSATKRDIEKRLGIVFLAWPAC
jgi:hypothetical protein